MAERFDWPGLLRVAVTRLRLRPEDFWALTPFELRLMLGEGGGTAPLTSGGLAELARAFPDLKPEENDGGI